MLTNEERRAIRKQKDRERRANQPGRDAERRRIYRAAHPQQESEYGRKWRAEHPGYMAEWRAEHREYTAEWRAKHPGYILEKNREWLAEHPGYLQNWRIAHPEQVASIQSKYRMTRRGRAIHIAQRHNRRVRLNGIPLTADVILELKSEYAGICPYCNRPIIKGHIDHIVPVSRGGTNARDNLVWVCATCNLLKFTNRLLDFLLDRIARPTP
jgi:5-methylcytosine-specific restriction endonuclease McrA